MVRGGFVDTARSVVQDTEFVELGNFLKMGSAFALIGVWFVVFCAVDGVSVSDAVRSEIIISCFAVGIGVCKDDGFDVG